MIDLPRPDPVFYASKGNTAYGLEPLAKSEKYWDVRDPLLAEVGQVRQNARQEWHYPGYRMERLTLAPEEFAPFTGRVAYIPGDQGPMPDFAPWVPCPVVHDNLRRIVEEMDPHGSYFHPADIPGPNGMLRSGRRYLWLARRRIWKTETQSFAESLDNIFRHRRFTPPGVPNAFANDIRSSIRNTESIWQMISDPKLRARMRLLPVWGFSMDIQNICISAPLLNRLKEAGLTGFDLQTADHPADFVPGEVFVGV